MSVAPVLASRGIESFPGTCKIDISAKIQGCTNGVEIIVGDNSYDVTKKPEYIIITPTKGSDGDYGHHDVSLRLSV